MRNPRLAKRYAKSLIDLSVELKQLDPVFNDIMLLKKISDSSREFVVMLKSPVIHAGQKIKIISAIVGNNISQTTNAFINLLCRKNREDNLPEILISFISQYNQIKGIHTATLTTAVAVSEDVLKDFHSRIINSTKVPHLNLENKVEDKIVGGFILEMEGKLIDASILRDLIDIKKQFASNEYMHRLR